MFTIIGGDGKEYGPVPVEQVRTWLAAGRANLETQAKKAGDDQWHPLGDFPEFAPAGTDRHESEPPPLTPESGDPKNLAQELIARAAPLDVFGCFDRSWQLLKANFWSLVGITFLVVIVQLAVARFFGYLPGPHYFFGPKLEVGPDTLAKALLNAPFYGGLYYYYLQKIHGQPTGIGDAFIGFSRFFIPLFLVGLLTSLFTGVGVLLLFLPGIYLGVAYTFASMLVVDRGLSFWPAMEISRRVITAQWWRILAVLLLGLLVALLGLALLLVGIFFTLPICIGAVAYAYQDLCHPPAR